MLLEWRFKKIRLKEQKKLNSTNLYLYKSITVYIQNSNLRTIEKEEILQQIIDMLLQAQMENKSADLIIGQNYEEFCKSVIEEYGSGRGTVYNSLDYIQKYFLWTILISAFITLLRGILSQPFYFGINLNQLILANVISLIIIPASKKERQKTSSIFYLPQRFYMINEGLTKSTCYSFLSALLCVGLLNLIFEKSLNSEILSYTIVLYKTLPYAAIILLFILSIEVYKKYITKGRIL
ncbi:hypothetical protein AB8U03_14130 [Clostridium sp. Mt-5]|uniref:Uncharacterized protein n=1 Tax=Clostridium moutaii TaxID=3240932 RepID=A0ABV4BS05_9CLOT